MRETSRRHVRIVSYLVYGNIVCILFPSRIVSLPDSDFFLSIFLSGFSSLSCALSPSALALFVLIFISF